MQSPKATEYTQEATIKQNLTKVSYDPKIYKVKVGGLSQAVTVDLDVQSTWNF